jgi:hypothetical protein
MSQAISLSDELVQEARAAAEAAKRPIGGQIEHWARLGRAFEPLINRSQSQASENGAAVALSECFASINTAAGRERLKQYLDSTPFPHYEPAPGETGLLVRINADGTRVVGRFVDREFRPVG